MNEKAQKVLIGIATTALIGVAAYYTCKLAMPAAEKPLADPLPGTERIERIIIVNEKKK